VYTITVADVWILLVVLCNVNSSIIFTAANFCFYSHPLPRRCGGGDYGGGEYVGGGDDGGDNVHDEGGKGGTSLGFLHRAYLSEVDALAKRAR
jgi:hypothetical protein